MDTEILPLGKISPCLSEVDFGLSLQHVTLMQVGRKNGELAFEHLAMAMATTLASLDFENRNTIL